MESFGNGSSARKVVSVSGNDDLLNLFSGEKKQKIGSRVRAFLDVSSAIDKAEAEGWDWDQLRSYLTKVQEGTVSAGTGNSAVVKRVFYVGKSRRGNLILQTNAQADLDDLKEMFESCWSYKNKKAALAYIDSKEVGEGIEVF